MLLVMPAVARAAPEDFYLPKEYVDAVVPRWHPSQPMSVVEGDYTYYGAKRPVRAEKTPGRNDPCTCGSGKKYKRCCGGG